MIPFFSHSCDPYANEQARISVVLQNELTEDIFNNNLHFPAAPGVESIRPTGALIGSQT